MSSDQAGSTNKKPGFRPGVCVKNNKLYAFSEVRVVVVRGWPEMAAWTKTYRKPQWSRFRPRIDFQEGSIEATRSQHRCQPGQYGRHSPDLEDPFQPNSSDRMLIELLDSDRAEVRQMVSEWALSDWKYSREEVQTEDSSDPDVIRRKKRDEASVHERELVRHYFGNVPWEIRQAIAPFENRHWHLLVMAARCAGSLSLVKSNPALAFCLASCWAFCPHPSKYATRTMRKLIGFRRRNICGELGFSECECSVSVLSKIPASACCVSWLLTIRDLLRDPEWRKPLLHLPSLNLSVMHFLCNKALRRRTTPRLLHELSGIDGPALVQSASDVLRMQRELGDPGSKPFQSVEQFMRLHNELEERTNHPEEADIQHLSFPEPPIPGSENIIALKTPDLLVEEAGVQRNCVMRYATRTARGGIYLYRVIAPERATLSIEPDAQGGWQIDELLAAENKPVSEEARKAVERWIKRAGKPGMPNGTRGIL